MEATICVAEESFEEIAPLLMEDMAVSGGGSVTC